MLDMLEPCKSGIFLIPIDFIHQITGEHPIFWNMDMERKLHVFLDASWENALFVQGFQEIQLELGADERIKTVRKWMAVHHDVILGIRTQVKTYYETLFGFSLDGATILVLQLHTHDALVSIQPPHNFNLPEAYKHLLSSF